MTDTSGDRWGAWARRWPRYAGLILLAAAVQSGVGAWATGGAVAAYLAGCAVTAGVVGGLLLIVPLPAGGLPRKQSRAEPGAAADRGGISAS
jgi:hypothetical protein